MEINMAKENQANVEFRIYNKEDYDALYRFFVEISIEGTDINWNWARFEWMMFHAEFDEEACESIGIWCAGDRIVAASVYDMYFGEAFCGTLPGYEYLYIETVGYAQECLADDSGLGIAIWDKDETKIKTAQSMGMNYSTQGENIMGIELDNDFSFELPEGMSICSFDPSSDDVDYEWLMWQGFDHGSDRAEYEANGQKSKPRPHLNTDLCIAVKNVAGEIVAHACIWYNPETDFAYVEPVFTLPEYRKMGLAKAAVYEGLNRARKLGAAHAYVISDQEFYAKLGFVNEKHYTFWWTM